MRTDIDLVETLEDLARQAPSGQTVLRDLALARRRRDARRRIVWAAVGVTAVLVAVLAITVPMTLRQPQIVPAAPVRTDQRVPGNWSMLHTVTPPSGWRVAQVEVYLDAEQSVLAPNGDTSRDRSCSVVLETAAEAASRPKGTPTTIAGQRGSYSAPTTDQVAAEFFWTPTGNDRLSLWATCGGMRDPRAAIAQLIPGVHLRHQEVRLPFRLTELPAGVFVKAVYQGDERVVGTQGAGFGSNDDSDEPPRIDAAVTQARPFFDGAEVARTTIGGRDVEFESATSTACFTGPTLLCVSDTSNQLGTPPPGGLSDTMLALLAAIQPEADLDDPSSWPIANGAIPR